MKKPTIPEEELQKLSRRSQDIIRELLAFYDDDRQRMEQAKQAAEENKKLLELLRAKQKEMEDAGTLPEGTHKHDPDAPSISEWTFLSTGEFWLLPTVTLPMKEFSFADSIFLAYLIDTTRSGEREIKLSRPHAAKRTGMSTVQVSKCLKKLEARNLIETKQTGREVKVKLTGAKYLVVKRRYRLEPKEGGII